MHSPCTGMKKLSLFLRSIQKFRIVINWFLHLPVISASAAAHTEIMQSRWSIQSGWSRPFPSVGTPDLVRRLFWFAEPPCGTLGCVLIRFFQFQSFSDKSFSLEIVYHFCDEACWISSCTHSSCFSNCCNSFLLLFVGHFLPRTFFAWGNLTCWRGVQAQCLDLRGRMWTCQQFHGKRVVFTLCVTLHGQNLKLQLVGQQQHLPDIFSVC